MSWTLSSSSDPDVLAVVDGLGKFRRFGPHYSRRTPGSKTFTGVGKEIVLLHETGRAVWACVYQKTPAASGSGMSRERGGITDARPRFIWRNMMFRNLYAGVASELIQEATERTYEEWIKRYGALPVERLRTEIGIAQVRSENPGRCYRLAGWIDDRVVRGKLYMWAPERAARWISIEKVMDLPVPVWNDPGSLSGEIISKEETMAKNLYNVTAPATITGVVEASDDKDAAEKFRALVKAIFGQSGLVVSIVGDPKVTAVAAAKAGDKSKASDEDEEEEEEDEDEDEEEEDEDEDEEEDDEDEEEEEEDEKPAKKSAGKKADKKPEGKKVKIKLK